MGIFNRAFRGKRAITLATLKNLEELFSGGTTDAGITVNEEKALAYSTIFGCVRLIGETLASLPWILYERTSNGDRRRATNHPLYSILHDRPNPAMSRFAFIETIMAHLLLWGNAYAEKVLDRAGVVQELWPIHPRKVTPRQVGSRLVYDVELPDGTIRKGVPNSIIWHVPGPGFDGIKGYSRISMARQSIAAGMAADKYAAKFFSNGNRLSGVFSAPGSLSDTAFERLDKAIRNNQGLDAAHRTLLVEEGVSWQATGIPQQDAQFLETRQWHSRDIASKIFGVQPHLLGDLADSHHSNIEHQGIEAVVYLFRPWLVRLEQVTNWSLLSDLERTRYYSEFLVDGLMRGDLKTRYESYAIARNWGWLSANDIRRLENLNRIDGGDQYLVPLNMVQADRETSPRGGLVGPGRAIERLHGPGVRVRRKRSLAARKTARDAYRILFRDAAGRLTTREVNEVRKLVRKLLAEGVPLDEISREISAHYEAFRETTRQVFRAVIWSYAEAIVAAVVEEMGLEESPQLDHYFDSLVDKFAESHSIRSVQELQGVIQAAPEDLEGTISGRLDRWAETRPDVIANRQVVKLDGAVSLAAYGSAGAVTVTWVASGETCELCQELDGQTITIGAPFREPGDAVGGNNEDKPTLKIAQNIFHPPLHEGCDCSVSVG